MATDINFPIKMAAIDGSWSIEYKNIKTLAADNLFDLPAGYKKMSIPAMPAMGGGMQPPRMP
jgi:hypothetical protein